ncbi:MAG: hypothetical protein K8R23_16570 [Chthoniobacter sp.]|nr:hypothetical protein [Chthoniobacter sp.]
MYYQTCLAHFRANREDRPEPDWSAPFVIGGEKLRLLRRSLAEYQFVTAASAAGLTVFHIERPDELDPAWFCDAQNVGLTPGTSTLKETVAAVQVRLEEIAERQEHAIA